MHLPDRLGSRHILLLIVITVALLILLVWTRPAAEPELRSLPAPRVVAIPVAKKDLFPEVEVTGRLLPVRRSELRFEVSGQVVERLAEPGQRVAAAQVLLRLDDGDFADGLATARAQLAQEEAGIARDRRLLRLATQNRELQAKEVARFERLRNESLASKTQLGEATQRLLQLESEEARLRYSVETAQARLSLRQAEVNRAERSLARSRLEAPFAGTVNKVEVEVGDFVSSNQTALELVDASELDLYAEVTGATAAALSLGQAVIVRNGAEEREGRIVAVQRDANPSTYTYAVRIRTKADGMLPGGLAVAVLPLQALREVLAVPVTAMLHEEGYAYVYVVSAEGTVAKQAVNPGPREGENVVVRSGIREGQTIVARDVALLSDGQQVTLAR